MSDLGLVKYQSDIIRYIQFIIMKGLHLESKDGQERFFKAKGILEDDKTEKLANEIEPTPFYTWKNEIRNQEFLNNHDFKTLSSEDKNTIVDLGNTLFSKGVGHSITWSLGSRSKVQIESVKGKSDAPQKSNFIPLCYFLYYASCERDRNGQFLVETGDVNFKAKWLPWLNNHITFKTKVDESSEEIVTTNEILKDSEPQPKTTSVSEDFHETYPKGEYNVEFMEEGSTIDNPKYAVSRLVFTKTSVIHYYQLLTSGRIVRATHKVRESSNKTSFHLYEVDSDWGYRFSIPRPDPKEGTNNFWVLYEGVREEESTRFLGVGIARRIFPGDDAVLPIRMVEALDADHLRVAEDLEAITQKFVQQRNEKADLRKAYNDLFNKSGKINSTSERILKQVTQLLDEKGPPIEVNDKGGIKFD